MFVTIRKERNVLPQVLPRDLAADYQQEYASRIVAVKLDNTLHDLQTPVGKSRSIEFVELESEEGWIIYRRSVEFLLVMAVHELYPEAEVAAMFRANNGLYCEISVPGKKLTEAMAQAIEAEMRRLVEEDRPIVKEVLEREAAVKLFKETKQVEKANLIASLKLPKVSIYRCGDYYDYLYGAMIGSTGHLGKFALDIFESGVLLRTPDLKSKGKVPPSVPQPKLSEVLTEAKNWANILRCRYVTDLNRAIRSGRISEVIRVSEALQEKHIAEIADYIAKHRQKLRLILIAGPSSSGKTSFAQRLRVQLQVMGLRPFSISLDNYFVNREDTPKTPAGAYDYECLEALDVDLFNKDMFALLKGESVVLPRYNFKTGEREWEGQTPLTLEKSQPIMSRASTASTRSSRQPSARIQVQDLRQRADPAQHRCAQPHPDDRCAPDPPPRARLSVPRCERAEDAQTVAGCAPRGGEVHLPVSGRSRCHVQLSDDLRAIGLAPLCRADARSRDAGCARVHEGTAPARLLPVLPRPARRGGCAEQLHPARVHRQVGVLQGRRPGMKKSCHIAVAALFVRGII